MLIQWEWIGEKGHWTRACIHSNRCILAQTTGKGQRPKDHVCVCELTNTIAKGRHFEAILTGPQENQKWTSTPLNNMDQVEQACGNCGRAHPPRACPAYKDSCKVCGKITRWKKFCWKLKGTNCLKEDCKQRSDIDWDSWRRDQRFHDLEPAASYSPHSHLIWCSTRICPWICTLCSLHSFSFHYHRKALCPSSLMTLNSRNLQPLIKSQISSPCMITSKARWQ